MATQTIQYGTRTALTITLAGLASGGYREATEVDNSTDLAVDGALHGKITTGTSPTADSNLIVHLVGSDGTGTRPANLSGVDAAVTVGGEQYQMEVARVIPVDATSDHTYEFYVGSIAALFGGVLPKKFSVVIANNSGVALNATGANHEIYYTPVKYDVA